MTFAPSPINATGDFGMKRIRIADVRTIRNLVKNSKNLQTMKGVFIKYEHIEEVVSDVNKQLIIKLKKNDETNKIRRHFLKQHGSDHIDKNIKK